MMRISNKEGMTHRAGWLWFASSVRDCGSLATQTYGQAPSFLQGGIGPGGRAPLA